MGTPPATTLFVIRHGETQWNLDERFQGHGDSPLTADGRAQADALGKRMQSMPIDEFIASDLGRAQETASIISNHTGHEVLSDHRLRERNFGVLEGLNIGEIKKQFPDVLHQIYTIGDPDFVIPEGESHRQHYLRNIDFFEELIRTAVGKRIALVVHGGVLDSLLRYILAADLQQPRSFMAANTSLSVIHYGVFYGTQRWMVETWGDVSHLNGVGFRQGIA